MKKILSLLVLILLLNDSRSQSNDLMVPQLLAGGDIHFGVNISSWEEERWEVSGDVVVRDERPDAGKERVPGASRYTLAAKEQQLMAAVENMKTPEVGLLRFTAAGSAGEVAIEWVSVRDRPLNYFLVQRSENNRQWQDLGIILVPSDARAMTSYQYIDPYPHKGTNYYRLNQADTRAHIAESEVIAVEMMDIGYHVLHIFPNATIFGANISLHLNAPAEVDISLQDASGVEVGKIYAANTREGLHSIDIDMASLPQGKYDCVIRVGNSVAVRELEK